MIWLKTESVSEKNERQHRTMAVRDHAQIMTGVAEASFPTSSSSCMIFLIRAYEVVR